MDTATTVSVEQREPQLLGQTVVVIGGSAGIGLKTTGLARAEGADVNRERSTNSKTLSRSARRTYRPWRHDLPAGLSARARTVRGQAHAPLHAPRDSPAPRSRWTRSTKSTAQRRVWEWAVPGSNRGPLACKASALTS
jgi:NAD(P)-dependent dehydrogenase (short-subunit alcohol dehydrogenase family)